MPSMAGRLGVFSARLLSRSCCKRVSLFDSFKQIIKQDIRCIAKARTSYQVFSAPVVYVFKRTFHTTPRRHVPNPLFIVLAKKLANVGAVIIGRTIRRSIPKHKDPAKSLLTLRVIIGSLLGAGCLWIIISFYMHNQPAPVTGRIRHIAFSSEQFKEIAGLELESIFEDYKGKVMSSDDNKHYDRARGVVIRIIAANMDIAFFKDQKWTVTVIDSDIANAFVQPTGDIVVFKGLLDFAQNDDQLAVVLAHELSHVYLSHGAEKVSVMGLVDNIMIILTLAVWAFMPSDISALIMQMLYGRFLSVLLHLPYSRMLEDEADEVGIQLMAKACYDVREASNFWRMMETWCILGDQISQPEFLSTHPHHLSRSDRLDDLTYKALKIRADCENCKNYKLPNIDPREHGEKLYRLAVQEQERLRRLEEQNAGKPKQLEAQTASKPA